tara:strand:+ start:151 stop:294 length:144 start_codon:yes stop_codon:yes gene_type:complete
MIEIFNTAMLFLILGKLETDRTFKKVCWIGAAFYWTLWLFTFLADYP